MYRLRVPRVKGRLIHVLGRFCPVLLVVACLLTSPRGGGAQCPPLDAFAPRDRSAGGAARSGGSPACRFDATLTRLFTPHSVPGAPYHVYVTSAAIEKLAARFGDLSPAAPVSSGAWTVQEMDPLEALGDAGPYNPAKVGRLYVGQRARVARGPIVRNGRTIASITLMSPYPDPSLTHLEPGTMIIEFRIANQDPGAGYARDRTGEPSRGGQ